MLAGLVTLAVLFAAVFSLPSVGSAETARVLQGGQWKNVECLTVKELAASFSARAEERTLCEYGGLASGVMGKATGFFHTERVGGRWLLIDPHGHNFVSVGLCSVNRSQFSDEQIQRKYGTLDNWVQVTGQMLKSAGFNTLGCWSEWEPFRRTEHRMPYTPRWNFMQTYKNTRPATRGKRGYPKECMPVFDPEFAGFCEQHAKQLAKTSADPWLLGHFSDNELPFRPDSLNNYLSLPTSDFGRTAAETWWHARSRGETGRKITSRDQEAFLRHVAERYYTVVNAAMKKYDPNHLYLGSRIHGRTISEPVFEGSRCVDVVSVNYYHRWSPEQDRMTRWVECSGRPFLISEWYAKSLRSKDTETGGAGFRVATDRDRGLFYQNMTLGLLQHPGCVGWHWFKYAADEKDTRHGLVDDDFAPYAALLNLMADVNQRVYLLQR